ncbi:MAG: hypothetical protein ACOCVF_01135 [bacterium]
MEEMTKLLSQLAEKLGTTTEYLWEIMIRQAPISAFSNLLQILFVIIYGIILWKIHVWLTKPVSNEDSNHSRYYKHDELVIIPMLIAAVIFIVFAVASFFSFPDIINGFFNPEYWALDNIIKEIKE